MSDWKVTAFGEDTRTIVGWQVSAPTPLDALREALSDAESASLAGGTPPIYQRAEVALTVTEDDQVLAVVNLVDPQGRVHRVHLAEEVIRDLSLDLAVAHRQLNHGQKEMPPPWRRGVQVRGDVTNSTIITGDGTQR